MADEHYVLPPPHRPWYVRVSADRWFALAAIVVSTVAAVFTGWYAWDNHQIRIQTKASSDRQLNDVERARKAAEDSATASKAIAESLGNILGLVKSSGGTAKQQLDLSREEFHAQQRPILRVQTAAYAQPEYAEKIRVINVGRTPALGVTWKCHALPLENNGQYGKPHESFATTPFELAPNGWTELYGALVWSDEMKDNKFFRVNCDVTYGDDTSHDVHHLQVCYEMFARGNNPPFPQHCGTIER